MAFENRFFENYLDPLQVEIQVSELANRFPNLCRIEELPFLSHGYEGEKVEARGRHKVRMLRITAPGTATPKPAVLVNRSTHAREWINPIAVLETALQLMTNFRPDDPDPQVQEVVRILNKVEFLIIAESNPDGARLSFFDEGRRLWRKNLRPPNNADGCAGVDCNRNFSRFWGQTGSSPLPCAEIYRGPGPISEPETANIAHVSTSERTLLFAIDSHSFGQALFRPHQPQGISSSDDAVYRRLEETMNNRIRQIQGVTYATGTTNMFAGTCDDYLFLEHHIFGFTVECGEDFQPPFAEAMNAALEVAEAAKALGLCAAGEVPGVDVDLLLQQRTPVPDVESVTAAFEAQPVAPWKVEPLSPEKWPRYLAGVAPKRDGDARQEFEALVAEGFDARYDEQKGIEVVASASNLTALLNRGYELLVKRDLLSGADGD
ncbi:MAG TPA: M14 family zinc carboxypeptidase [Pyrinomonadaceae bacterium]|nr:M14 family zinc carboxypeptidase [Pyrinomonadaceae bacterium]